MAEVFRMFPPVGPNLTDLVVSLEDDEHPLRALDNLEGKGSKLPVNGGALRRTQRKIGIQLVSALRKWILRVPVVLELLGGPGLERQWHVPEDGIVGFICLRIDGLVRWRSVASRLAIGDPRHPHPRQVRVRVGRRHGWRPGRRLGSLRTCSRPETEYDHYRKD